MRNTKFSHKRQRKRHLVRLRSRWRGDIEMDEGRGVLKFIGWIREVDHSLASNAEIKNEFV